MISLSDLPILIFVIAGFIIFMVRALKTYRLRNWLAPISVAAGYTMFTLSGVSHELPPPLTADERAAVRRTHFDYTVGLEGLRAEEADAALALKGTGLFKAVDSLDHLPSSPDLVARGGTIIKGTPIIPFEPMLTFGIVPSKVQEGWGYWFSFHAPNAGSGGKEVEIQFSFKGTTVLGWTSRTLNNSPDWVEDTPLRSQRLYDRLAFAIALKAEEIRRSVVDKSS